MIQLCRTDISSSALYIVPTPIGNLGDITQRALKTLSNVDLIAAEDTRHVGRLLQYFSINKKKLFALHEYNEKEKTEILLVKILEGKNIALVSDAGTPLINDPGYYLVLRCYEVGVRVIPLPGACAAITALSASGLPCNRFCYEGFLPAKRKARCNILHELKNEQRTLIFYESTHRLIDSLKDMIAEWGEKRYVVLARELTKVWESFYGAPLDKLLKWMLEDKNRCKGEIVLIIEGYKTDKNKITIEALKTLTLLQKSLPLKTAAALTSKIHNIKKNIIYKYGLK